MQTHSPESAFSFQDCRLACSVLRKRSLQDSEPVPAESVLSGQLDTVNMQQAPEGETDMSAQTYSTRELWVQNDGSKIYGIAYVPDVNEKVPLVIFSHELGN